MVCSFRRWPTPALVILMALALLVWGMVAARAAEVDVAPVAHLAGEYLVELVVALAGWGLMLLQRWIGIGLRKEARDTVLVGVRRLAAGIVTRHGSGPMPLDVHSQAIEGGVSYLVEQAPQAVRRLGLGPDALARLLDAELAASGVAARTEPAP